MTRSRPQAIGPRAYRLLWDGHSIVGVVTGLALFVMFFCGALALYRGELHQWTDPALRTRSTEVASVDALVEPILKARPPKMGSSLLLVWPFGHRPYFYLQYEGVDGRANASWVVPHSGETLPYTGRSILPDLLNELHFFGQLGTAGQALAGVLGLVFLFVLIAGVAIHLRKLPEDLHTFRPRRRLRVSLADAHAALGTIGIPFTAMYALTGAYFSLLIVVYGGLVVGVLGGDRQRIGELTTGIVRPAFRPSHEAASTLPFDVLLSRFTTAYPGAPPFAIEIEGWGDAAGLATFDANAERSLGATAVATLNAVTGEVVVGRSPADTPPMTATAAGFGVLHFARFGGHLLKALFFVLALVASAVILTGNLLWIEVRRPRDRRATPWVHRVLARLTAGVGVGLVAAVPVAFVMTRMVPIDQSGRMAMEARTFFLSWLLFAGAALLLPSAVATARFLTAMSGVMAIIVPIANGIGTDAWLWVSAGRGHWAVFAIDACFLLAGLLLCCIAWRGRESDRHGREGQSFSAQSNSR